MASSTSPAAGKAPDMRKTMELLSKFDKGLSHAMAMAAVVVGHKLDLYNALVDTGPCTVSELAAHTKLHPRWLKEWLLNQTTVGYVTYTAADQADDDEKATFSLSPEQQALFAREEQCVFPVTAYASCLPIFFDNIDATVESFKTGIGRDYEDPRVAKAIDHIKLPWTRRSLVKRLKLVDGLVDALENGVIAADVGCGSGAKVCYLAKAFPKSHFHGYDTSPSALARANKRKEEMKVTNATFHNVSKGDALPEDGSLYFVIIDDAIHDMTDPKPVISAIRKSLRDDGVWINIEPDCGDSLHENVNHRMGALLSGFSLHLCMSSAMSAPGGCGLGTMGYGKKLAEQWCKEAGFTQFKVMDSRRWGRPETFVFEIRP